MELKFVREAESLMEIIEYKEMRRKSSYRYGFWWNNFPEEKCFVIMSQKTSMLPVARGFALFPFPVKGLSEN